MSRDARTNRRIRARELRVIGAEGEQLGILPLEVALRQALDLGMDLVEVNPMAKPPVCKIMDYGKFKYETKKRANEAKKKQVIIKTKEIKLRPRTDEHDYQVKLRAAREFLEEGHKIKVTIVFRGREIAHREIGQKQLLEMTQDLKDVAVVEQSPRMEGRSMFLLLGATKKIQAAVASAAAAAAAPTRPERPVPASERPPPRPRPAQTERTASSEKPATEKPATEKPATEKPATDVAAKPPRPSAPATSAGTAGNPSDKTKA